MDEVDSVRMLITLPRLVLTGEMTSRRAVAVDLARCRTMEYTEGVWTVTSRHSEIVEIKRASDARQAYAYAKRHYINAGVIWINPAYLQQIRLGDAAVRLGFAGLNIYASIDLAGVADAVRRAGLTEVGTGVFASLAQTLWYSPSTEEGIQIGMGYSVSPARKGVVLDLIAADDWIVHGNGILGNPAQIQMLHDDTCFYNSHHPCAILGQRDRLSALPWFDIGDGIRINLDHVDFIEEPASSEATSDEVTLWLDNGVSMALEREVASSVVRAAEAAQVSLEDGRK